MLTLPELIARCNTNETINPDLIKQARLRFAQCFYFSKEQAGLMCDGEFIPYFISEYERQKKAALSIPGFINEEQWLALFNSDVDLRENYRACFAKFSEIKQAQLLTHGDLFIKAAEHEATFILALHLKGYADNLLQNIEQYSGPDIKIDGEVEATFEQQQDKPMLYFGLGILKAIVGSAIINGKFNTLNILSLFRSTLDEPLRPISVMTYALHTAIVNKKYSALEVLLQRFPNEMNPIDFCCALQSACDSIDEKAFHIVWNNRNTDYDYQVVGTALRYAAKARFTELCQEILNKHKNTLSAETVEKIVARINDPAPKLSLVDAASEGNAKVVAYRLKNESKLSENDIIEAAKKAAETKHYQCVEILTSPEIFERLSSSKKKGQLKKYVLGILNQNADDDQLKTQIIHNLNHPQRSAPQVAPPQLLIAPVYVPAAAAAAAAAATAVLPLDTTSDSHQNVSAARDIETGLAASDHEEDDDTDESSLVSRFLGKWWR